ncbi:IS110 family transposase [Thioclava sediminum]|uniref:IS110 family transposase n=1 Tax=Thioclava sediminum TaxID=1915319 RepID=UPI003CC656FC
MVASWIVTVRRTTLENYAGLDVSLKEISICVVDRDGKTVARGTPIPRASLAGFATGRSSRTASCMRAGCCRSGCSTVSSALAWQPPASMPGRRTRACQRVSTKSDAGDAEGLAQLARTGWFTPVHIRTEASDRLRAG